MENLTNITIFNLLRRAFKRALKLNRLEKDGQGSLKKLCRWDSDDLENKNSIVYQITLFYSSHMQLLMLLYTKLSD